MSYVYSLIPNGCTVLPRSKVIADLLSLYQDLLVGTKGNQHVVLLYSYKLCLLVTYRLHSFLFSLHTL